MRRIVGLSRFIVIIGSVSSLLTALLLSLAVGARVVTLYMDRDLWLSLGSKDTTETLIVAAVKQADAALIAAALLIIGIGLYGLFIGRLEYLPPWLDITSLNDLKGKLISVVVVVTAVDFFTSMVEREGGIDILILGSAAALVILSLAAFNYARSSKEKEDV